MPRCGRAARRVSSWYAARDERTAGREGADGPEKEWIVSNEPHDVPQLLSDEAHEASVPPPLPVVEAPRKPRVWPSLLATPAALVIAGVLQAGLFGVLDAMNVTVVDDKDMFTPAAMLVFLSLLQLTLLMFAVGAARSSREPWRQRLSIARPRASVLTIAAAAMASPFIGGVIAMTLYFLGAETPEHLVELSQSTQQDTLLGVLGMVLVIGVLAGVCEEFLFRGYIQTRLVARFGPVCGIGAASLLFAIMHLNPMHSMIALALGIWCGLVVWLTGSVWTGVLCHVLNNSLWVVLSNVQGGSTPEGELGPLAYVVMAVSGTAFVLAIVRLRAEALRRRAQALETSHA